MTVTKPIQKIAIIGTGVIGASWAAQFLAKGLDVVATDVAPGAETALRRFVKAAWPALERLGLAPGASQSRLTFSRSADRRGRGGLDPGKRAREDRLQEEALSPAG
jgi:3-hydroxyacyl-CoA dehydrogenase